ncbi:MAG: hypothetical protein ABI889_14480 [Gemmatimonadota bacterium]
MIATRSARLPLALACTLLAACAKGTDANADSAAASAAAPVAAAPAAPRAQMGMMMGDSAMIMLAGFCGSDAGDSASGPRVDLIVNGDAAQRASQVMINVVSAPPGDLKAELVAGREAHTMCGGHARRIYIGGTTMFLGNPTLTLSSAVPVTIAARSTLGAMLGTSMDVKPGQKGAVLKWDAAPASKQ